LPSNVSAVIDLVSFALEPCTRREIVAVRRDWCRQRDQNTKCSSRCKVELYEDAT
jgi:hypothetical protein